MSDAAPPAWVRKLGLPSGQWRCLVGLWGFARYDVEGPAKVWPSRATLAEATGQKPATVAKQLRQLAELGYIERLEGTAITLAWLAPVEPESPGRRPESPPRRPQSPTTTVADPTTTVTQPTTTVADPRRPQSPLTFQGTSNSTSNITSGKPAHVLDVVKRAARTPDEFEPDPFDAALRAVSEAAFAIWSPGDQSTHSFSWGLAQFIRENSEADAFAVLTAWEGARGDRSRPRLAQLWYTGGKLGRGPAAFRDKVLGREEVAAKQHSDGALSDQGVDKFAEFLAIEAGKAAAKAVAS